MAFGLLNVHKPVGPTSHDIVAAVRRGTGERRAGHAGTLDPLASGVLVLALGKATRLMEYMSGAHKAYRAQVTLGLETDTYDTEGEVLAERPLPANLTRAQVEAALEAFRGTIMQRPPAYSAVKVGGKSAHRLARAGKTVELAARPVQITRLALAEFTPPVITLEVECSAGTYIRSLAHDLGAALGVGGTLSALVRTASGSFRLDDAVGWEALTASFAAGDWAQYLLPAGLALAGTPELHLDAEDAQRIANGQAIAADAPAEGLARAYGPDGQLAAVVEGSRARGEWQPRKVFI